MRTINEQIRDIANKTKTIAEILSEGVGDYGIRYFSPSAANCNDTEGKAYMALYRAWREQNKPKTHDTIKPNIEMKKCSCGHTIPTTLVMNASMGSSCPDCYDKMSD